jgi:hypothetical protein
VDRIHQSTHRHENRHRVSFAPVRLNELEVALLDAFPLARVPDHMPATASGKRLHRHIAFRWALRGARGVLLRTIEVPGVGKCTTKQWLAEFVALVNAAAVAAAPTGTAPPKPRCRRSPQRHDRTAATQEVLARHGLAGTEGNA